jgi:hypothetical protein
MTGEGRVVSGVSRGGLRRGALGIGWGPPVCGRPQPWQIVSAARTQSKYAGQREVLA